MLGFFLLICLNSFRCFPLGYVIWLAVDCGCFMTSDICLLMLYLPRFGFMLLLDSLCYDCLLLFVLLAICLVLFESVWIAYIWVDLFCLRVCG